LYQRRAAAYETPWDAAHSFRFTEPLHRVVDSYV
jgi:hypothetical protein